MSPIFKLQGTIDDLTFVNSKRYKPHVRARKNSKTPFVMTASIAEGMTRMQQCNQYAKPVYQALRAEVHDGGLWSRLVSQLFAELKAGRPLGLECLKGFECNLQHPLSEVITKGYDLSATESQNQLGIYVQLHGHPKVEDGMPRTGYQLRFVAIIPDAENDTVQKVEVLGPLTKYSDELIAHDLKMELPGKGAPYILLMGIVPHLRGEGAARIMSDSGMKVVWVEEAASCEMQAASGEKQATSGELRATSRIQEGKEKQAAEERQAASCELRVASGRQPGMMREETSTNGGVEVVGVQATRGELRNASGSRSVRTREKTSGNRTTEVVCLVADAAAAGKRQATKESQAIGGELPPGQDKLRATRGSQDACAACPSHALAPAKPAWDDGAKLVSGSRKKGPEPLLINMAG